MNQELKTLEIAWKLVAQQPMISLHCSPCFFFFFPSFGFFFPFFPFESAGRSILEKLKFKYLSIPFYFMD